MSNMQELSEQQAESLSIEITVGNNAKWANDMFIKEYIESRRMQLLSEYLTINVNDSKSIFKNKYDLDALQNLEENIEYLISSAEAAALKLEMLREENKA